MLFKSFTLLLIFATASVLAQGDVGCSLTCRNGGTCDTGSANNAFSGATKKQSNDKTALPPKDERDNSQSHHCFCPTGYTGPLCEIKYHVCEGDERTCFNGSECIRNVDDRGKTFYHCQCDAVASDLSSVEAHKFCQHIWTEFCTAEGETIDKSSSFCTNGGVCKDKKGKSKYHAGCKCPEGWGGHHCEIPQNALTEFEQRGDHSIVMVFVLLLIFAMVGVVGFFVYHGSQGGRRRRGTGKRGRYPAEQEMNISSIEFSPVGYADDDDEPF
jgi:hypothetical protein